MKTGKAFRNQEIAFELKHEEPKKTNKPKYTKPRPMSRTRKINRENTWRPACDTCTWYCSSWCLSKFPCKK